MWEINKNNVLQYWHGSTSDKLAYKNEYNLLVASLSLQMKPLP